ncbi:DnaT-like ssDNA-binding domain-containing protein [Endozoicomonas sp. 2B-B]
MTDEERQKQKLRREWASGDRSPFQDFAQERGEEHPVFARQTTGSAAAQSNTLAEGARVQPLPEDFTPDAVYIEFLEAHHGIPADFTLAQLPEFKLYWLETGEARKAWQNKFKNHVIYQWKRGQSEEGQRTHKSTVEKLTDTSWADGLQFDFDESDDQS